MERLQKVIANSGLTSRRKAEELIVNGNVKVNGKVVRELGVKVSSKDIVLVNDKALSKAEKVYYVLFKPEGYVSTTSDEKGRRTVMDLVPSHIRVYPVGRLDYNTSGVLLLTNDGDFANLMAGPKHNIEKEYRVKIKGLLRKETSKKLCSGVKIDNYVTKKAYIKDVSYNRENMTSYANITITEGKYHQVKKMFESVGHPVLKLKRVRYGCVDLKNMSIGEHRLLKPHELKKLRLLAS